ncbi:MAG: hypothetical protein HY340_02675 [Candidatus Kerfeldbacteria bacterium]|nr:hypothetical protein [Candidatus Kerfeldbacteria bacterium]
MILMIHDEIFAAYPELQIAVVVVRDADNRQTFPKVGELLRREIDMARTVFGGMAVSDHPNIRAWRAAYQHFTAASRYHSSVEALVTRAVKGKGMSRINALVDLYNTASLKYLVPIGGEDLKTIKGNIALRRAAGDEPFTALGSTENDPPDTGEVAYFDDAGCLCRRFNWREADRTKLTAATEHAIFAIEGLPPTGEIETKEAAYGLGAWIREYCGGTLNYFLLNTSCRSIEVPFP